MDFYKNLPPSCYIASFSALDLYYGDPLTEPIFIWFRGSLHEVAREFDAVEFPGIDSCDAVARLDGRSYLIRCIDEDLPFPRLPFSVQNLVFDPRRGVFLDYADVYLDVRNRQPRLLDEVCCTEETVTEGAQLFASYAFPDNPFYRGLDIPWQPLGEYEQRLILTRVLTGRSPHRGLRILMESGFVHAFWPELAAMGGTEHAKEHHPEGNVWEHTLETFRYRKTRDLALSLGLLLHDTGKPASGRGEGNAFDRHAQIGSNIARRFMERLGFPADVREEAELLVREHMLPAFISRLPTYRTERVMSSSAFPKLLELYRCDLSSTFRGPDAYYEACKTYRLFLKHRRNPFRTAEGKKMLRLYVE